MTHQYGVLLLVVGLESENEFALLFFLFLGGGRFLEGKYLLARQGPVSMVKWLIHARCPQDVQSP